MWPYLKAINSKEFVIWLKKYIDSLGYWGFLVLFLLQILQVVVAIIPGGPFEIVAGMLYGPVIGSLITIIGSIFASIIIFKICKKYGMRFLLRFFSQEKVENWKWLEDSKQLSIITFIVYLIPGTPKDMLTYFLGTTKMSTRKFIVLSSLGRIPAIFVSASAGHSLSGGQFHKLIIFIAILLVLSIFSLLFKDNILKFFKEKHTKKDSNAWYKVI